MPDVTKVSLKVTVTIFALEGCLTVRTLRLPFSPLGTQNQLTATKVLLYSINVIYFRGDSRKVSDTLKRRRSARNGERKRCHITYDTLKRVREPAY